MVVRTPEKVLEMAEVHIGIEEERIRARVSSTGSSVEFFRLSSSPLKQPPIKPQWTWGPLKPPGAPRPVDGNFPSRDALLNI